MVSCVTAKPFACCISQAGPPTKASRNQRVGSTVATDHPARGTERAQGRRMRGELTVRENHRSGGKGNHALMVTNPAASRKACAGLSAMPASKLNASARLWRVAIRIFNWSPSKVMMADKTGQAGADGIRPPVEPGNCGAGI